MNSLGKQERLRDVRVIDHLFSAGRRLKVQGLMLVWDPAPCDPPFRMLIAVSKKKYPLAVRRNRIRRLVRESVRLNRSSLMEQLKHKGGCCSLAVVYAGPEKPSFQDVNTKIILFLRRLQNEYEKASG